jgi:tellurite resistance protein TerC
MQSIGTPALWLGFTIFVLVMLALDLGVFHRKSHSISVREALTWTGVWIALALVFDAGIYHFFGAKPALEFLTGYVIEKALSVDNLFVFLLVFGYFRVPSELQHGVLFWGILGALVMRALFIGLGTVLLAKFHFVFYIFGAFLVYAGVKSLFAKDEEANPENNPVLRLFRRFVRSVPDYRGNRISIVEDGKRYATPLLMVLVVIEATDIVFAIDSIPAIFAVSRDPFIVYTSNIFAILGLRSLYFALAGMLEHFEYLKIGVGLVLAFVGVKMLTHDFYEIPIGLSLLVILTLLIGSALLSLRTKPKAA